MSTDAALLRLLTWFSPAFPTGAFAHSHGIERAVEDGFVTSEAEALAWIATVIRDGAPARTRSCCVAPTPHPTRRPWRTSPASPKPPRRRARCVRNPARKDRLHRRRPRLGCASDRCRGQRRRCDPPPRRRGRARPRARDRRRARGPRLWARVRASLVSAALRLVPLGQTAALRIQHALEPAIAATAGASRHLTLDDLGTSALRVDVAFMRHETQRVRLFRT